MENNNVKSLAYNPSEKEVSWFVINFDRSIASLFNFNSPTEMDYYQNTSSTFTASAQVNILNIIFSSL